jgi:tetratricopeptide (TPR) repeat protein
MSIFSTRRVRLALGLSVVALAAGFFLFARARHGGSSRRVIVIGLDGADWQLLDGYRATGVMPELDRLVREGRPGVLRSLVPPLSPLVWTTIATGTSPVQHRILDFTRFNPATGQREPITSDERRAKAVWEMAGESGKDVAVFGLWATHPAEPVRGLMISDRLFSFQLKEAEPPAGAVHPASEEARVRAARAAVEAEVSAAAVSAYLPWLTPAEYESLASRGDPFAHPATALRRILVETRLYHRLAQDWLRRARPALSFVYFQGTDMIGHVFAPYAPPRQPAIGEAEYERYHKVPESYFREIDALLGDYRKIAEENGATILIVSDHGFLWGEGRPPRPDSLATATAGLWHRQEGLYLLWGRGIEPAGARGDGRVGQVTATILALLGLPRASGVEEPALGGIVESGQTRDYGPRTAAAPAGPAEPASAEALERLRALGYLGTGESATRPSTESGTRTAGSYNNEGLLLREAGRTKEALAAFEEALRLDPHAATAAHNLSVMLTDTDRARADALLLGALADGLGDGTRIVVSAANAHHQAGDPARARRLIDGAVERRPADPGLRVLRGRARLEARDCKGALADFEQALRAAPQAALIHGLAGTAMLCLGRNAEGRASLERSLALDPSQSRLREQLQRMR